MKENILKSKSFEFAIRIVNLNKYLVKQEREFVLSKQILRSGTSVGAMIAALAMSFSSVSVIANSLRLKNIKL